MAYTASKKAYISWLIITLLLAAVTVTTFYLFYSQQSQEASQVIDEGKRVIIKLEDGTIIAKASKEPAVKPEEPEQAILKEVAEEEATATAEKEMAEADPSPAEAPKEGKEAEVAEAPAPDEVASPEEAAPEEEAPTPQEQEAVAKTPETPQTPRIAIILTGVGLSKSSTEQAMELPAAISLSFSPYAYQMSQWILHAQSQQRDILVDLPMEPEDYPYSDPGPFALLTDNSLEENLSRMEEILSKGHSFIGMVSGANERFTEDREAMEPILKVMKSKGLIYVYESRPSNATLDTVAKHVGLPVFGAESVIDASISSQAIDGELEALEVAAEDNGYAVAIARPYPITIRRLQLWVRTLEGKGITLIPISALLPATSVVNGTAQ